MSRYAHNDTLCVFGASTPREFLGWNDYRTAWKNFLASMKGSPKMSLSELGVTIDGDVAYMLYAYGRHDSATTP